MSSNGFWRWLLWWSLWGFYAVTLRVFFRQLNLGRELLPRSGPYLLLFNHASMLDPVWLAWAPTRPIFFMASAALFRLPVLRHIIAALGAFPKVKFAKDRDAMAKLDNLYNSGEVVLISPEGTRTWDGRTFPIAAGIGRLVKRLDARVVVCRNRTGFLVQPRWARYPRWVPLVLEYLPPRVWGPDATPEQIVADIEDMIRIDPDVQFTQPTFGWRTAWGLEKLLWACPACYAMDHTSPDPQDGNALRCTACGAAWTVAVNSQLVPRNAQAPALRVREATDRLIAHFGDPPVADRARFEAEGVALEEASGRLDHLTGPGQPPVPVAEGRLQLTREGLRVLGPAGEERFALPFAELHHVTIEVRNELWLHTPGRLLRLEPAERRTLKWMHFLRFWRHRACTSDPGPPPPA